MSDWPAAPDPLPPLNDDAHVWSVALDDPRCEIDARFARLSPEEQARAGRFKFARDRRRYVIAHAALRDVLARYALESPADLRFVASPLGKPRLAPPFDAGGIEFNLSHSHERALIAVCAGHEIGVDIEYIKTDFDLFEVAQRFFTEREIAALYALPGALRSAAFHKCWTCKEAFLKAKGTGLSGQLDAVEIAFDQDRLRVTANVTGWRLRELIELQGYESALVTRDWPVGVFCYRWHGRTGAGPDNHARQ